MYVYICTYICMSYYFSFFLRSTRRTYIFTCISFRVRIILPSFSFTISAYSSFRTLSTFFLSLSLSLSLTHSLTLTLSLFLSRCIFFYRADQALCIICAAMSRSVSLRIAPYIRYTPRLCDRAKIDTRCNEQRQHRTKPNRRDIETRATRNRPIPFAEQEMRPSIARLQHAYRT